MELDVELEPAVELPWPSSKIVLFLKPALVPFLLFVLFLPCPFTEVLFLAGLALCSAKIRLVSFASISVSFFYPCVLV